MSTAATQPALDPLFVCAFCPSACRRAVPAELDQQVETRLPSALALLAVNLRQGVLQYDAELQAALQDLTVARACAKACSYGYDIAGLIATLSRDLDTLHGAAPDGPR